MKERFSVKDIPQEMLNQIRDTFEESAQIRRLRVEQGLSQRRGDYMGALKIGKTIEELFGRTVTALLSDVEKECHNVKVGEADLSEATRREMPEIMATIELAVDILDTAIMDFNDTLHREDTTLEMNAFDGIRQMGKMIKDKMKLFEQSSKMFRSVSFADNSDNMYQLLRNKARALLRKKYGDDK